MTWLKRVFYYVINEVPVFTFIINIKLYKLNIIEDVTELLTLRKVRCHTTSNTIMTTPS